MPLKIEWVQWGYTPPLPRGLKFDEETGTFSGTPTVPGEYTVPVFVETNYGSDIKDVEICVEQIPYTVYAVGCHAETWSNGAEPDAKGFRILSMPKAAKLYHLFWGFGAKTTDGLYVCGVTGDEIGMGGEEGLGEVSLPTKAPVNALDICFVSYTRQGDPHMRETILKTNEGFILVQYNSHNGYSQRNVDNPQDMAVKKLPDCDVVDTLFAPVLMSDKKTVFWVSHEIVDFALCHVFDTEIKKINGAIYNGATLYDVSIPFHRILYALTANGELYRKDRDNDIECVSSELGTIKDFWVNGKNIYVLTSSNKLYAKGYNIYNGLGVAGEYISYYDFVEVGTFDVKKIAFTNGYVSVFLLTNAGELYHTGRELPDITPAHETFTQILREYEFNDITLAGQGNTTQGIQVTLVGAVRKIWPTTYDVQALGKQASKWSSNIDTDGFYKLSIPTAQNLVFHPEGFRALSRDNVSYGCGELKSSTYSKTGGPSWTYTNTPTKLSGGDDITHAGGWQTNGTTMDISGRKQTYGIVTLSKTGKISTSKEEGYYTVAINGLTNTTYNMSSFSGSFPTATMSQMVSGKMTSKDPASCLSQDGRTIYILSYYTTTSLSTMKRRTVTKSLSYKAKKLIYANESDYLVLSESGYLNNNSSAFSYGSIKDAWFYGVSTSIDCYVQTTDNKLYIRKSDKWSLLGTYDVKKIDRYFMITNDGELYHYGDAAANISSHTAMAKISTNRPIVDIVYNAESDTLIVLKE